MIEIIERKFEVQPAATSASSAWDAFVDESPQGTLYCKQAFLQTLEFGDRRFWVRHGNSVVAALCFDVNRAGDIAGNGELMYSGLLFSSEVSADTASARNKRFEIAEFAAAWLTENFTQVNLRFPPQLDDVRPFSWHNYHEPLPAVKYQIDVQYTSYLDIENLDLAAEQPARFFDRLHPLRRRSMRAARREGAHTGIEHDPELLTRAYAGLMRRQNMAFDDASSAIFERRIDALISNGAALQFTTYEPGGKPVYTAVFGWDAKRVYYLYGAPIGDPTTSYQGTFCFLSAFEMLAARGHRVVDLEGVNSPRRGWFKLSFGGTLIPLFWARTSLARPT